MNQRFYILTGRLVFVLLVLSGLFMSCSAIYDDRDDCPEGLRIHFKYDYNMKYANAFAKEVTKVNLYVFDETGRFVKQQSEEGDSLKNENYYMKLNLDPGKYQLIAWGGLDDQSFNAPVLTAGTSRLEDLKVALKEAQTSKTDLHFLFHGFNTSDSLLDYNGDYQQYMIPMVKNTNRIRIILQEISGEKVDADAYRFEIVDDNSLMTYNNTVLSNGNTVYTPYTKGQSTVGDDPAVTVAYAEISTARLIAGHNTRLRVFRNADNTTVLDIPLIDYLMLTEMEGHKSAMTAQEYLDRQDEYSIVLFLNNLSWWNIKVIVNGWTVRLNETGIQ